MAWRFKASKYKNAVPVAPKPENCVRDVTVGSYQTYGHNIAASAAFMAFNIGQNGSNLAVLQIDDCGRKGKNMALLHGHADTVTDMSFSPFHDGFLATGSQDCLIKLWNIPKNGLENDLTDPECVLYSNTQRRVETVLFHPVADCLLSTTSFTALNLWDVTTQQVIYSNSEDHLEVIQCINWKSSGDILATTCKDKHLRIIDCRQEKAVVHELLGHQGIKDSRVVWLSDGNRLLTTGFNGARQREIFIRDTRKINQMEKSLELDSSSGILLPLYDPDTNMLFLAGKGDTSILYMEVTNREPFLIEGLRHNGEQTKGACLVPKRALNVMMGEVNRILQLTSSMVIPLTYQVPRKTYRDFHADLFPDTTGCISDLTPTEWMSGKNTMIPKISLDPSKRKSELIVLHRGSLVEVCDQINAKRKEQAQSNSKVVENSAFCSSKLSDKILKDVVDTSLELPKPIRNGSIKNRSTQDEEDCFTGEMDKSKSVEGNTPPPKPKPRSSRSNSVDFFEDRPKAKPRMHKNSLDPSQISILQVFRPTETEDEEAIVVDKVQSCVIQSVNPLLPVSGGYKPRLGPKPFTPPKIQSCSTTEKIPPSEPNNLESMFLTCRNPGQIEIMESEKNSSPQYSFFCGAEAASKDLTSVTEYEKFSTYESGFNDVSKFPESNKIYGKNDLGKICNKSNETNLNYSNVMENPSKKSLNEHEELTKKKPNVVCEGEETDEYIPKTPSMAQRRKLFEAGVKNYEVLEGVPGVKEEDLLKEEEKKNSIAERRRVYEVRTVSVQDQCLDEKTSPMLLSRKGSLKTRAEETKEEQSSRRSTLGGPIHVSEQKDGFTSKPKRTTTVFGRVSKFRHLKGTPMHKSSFIENIRNVSRQISGECDGFHANCERVAVPQSGPGGKIAVFETSKPGRLPDIVTPALVHGTAVMDFSWDNFDNRKLAVACDDGMMRFWIVPESGLTESTNQPHAVLKSHSDKIYCIKYHPLAKNVLASASYDMTVKIWDLSSMEEKFCLSGHSDQIFCLSWSPCGRFLGTVCKDGFVRIYDPRESLFPLKKGKGPVGTRGARLVWALEGLFLVVLGFDKVSERQIMIFKSTDLSQPITTVGLDVSPAILMPFYDEDSSTLFLTGRGDSLIYVFEVIEEPPYICPLSHHRCSSLHQGISFLSKNVCDVVAVEFARALRLTNNVIEPLSFTVPRIKTELFQDDLFPPTKVTWKPTMTSSEWFEGINKQPERITLKPENMKSLSAVSAAEKNLHKTSSLASANINSGFNKFNPQCQEYVKSKQEQIQKAVSSKMEINLTLEQNNMEGVDEQEWDE